MKRLVLSLIILFICAYAAGVCWIVKYSPVEYKQTLLGIAVMITAILLIFMLSDAHHSLLCYLFPNHFDSPFHRKRRRAFLEERARKGEVKLIVVTQHDLRKRDYKL